EAVVQAAAHHVERKGALLRETAKLREAGIDRDRINQSVQFPRGRPDERHLPLEALPRADLAAHPLLLDAAPGGVREPGQNLVRDVGLSDGAVKIAEHDGASPQFTIHNSRYSRSMTVVHPPAAPAFAPAR